MAIYNIYWLIIGNFPSKERSKEAKIYLEEACFWRTLQLVETAMELVVRLPKCPIPIEETQGIAG